MRGKLARGVVGVEYAGLIPAHAGKTITLVALKEAGGAHPRACGENAAHKVGDEKTAGSSPRMRGKLKKNGDIFAIGRLIPAHAGKTR